MVWHIYKEFLMLGADKFSYLIFMLNNSPIFVQPPGLNLGKKKKKKKTVSVESIKLPIIFIRKSRSTKL